MRTARLSFKLSAFIIMIATISCAASIPGIKEVSLPACKSIFPCKRHELTQWHYAIGNAANLVSLQWDIGPLGDALMYLENTEHYALDTEEGIAQWASLVPSDGGIIRIPGHDHQPLTISLFHQLRCLDVVRDAVVSSIQNRTAPSRKTVHCLNYLRQMVLCRADRYMENVRDPDAKHVVQFMGDRKCKDWTQVYAANRS